MAFKMVNVGIIGLGAEWEARYRPSIDRLRAHIRVRGIYDSVASRARLAGGQVGAQASTGMLALAKRCDVDALLLLDTAWYGVDALRMICRQGKPVYVAGWEAADYDTLLELYRLSREEGVTLMPELSRRYTPATGRLRELMATRIGRPRRMLIEVESRIALVGACHQPSGLPGWFDWSRYIVGTAPASIRAIRESSQSQSLQIEVQHHPFSDGSPGPSAEFRFRDAAAAGDAADSERIRLRFEGETGVAQLNSPFDIEWSAGDEQRSENLKYERNATELMLGLFCRRVVGGLIPVADLNDACRGIKMQRSVCDSLAAGGPIRLNGEV